MKPAVLLLSFLLMIGAPARGPAMNDPQAAAALDRFIEATGGLEALRGLKNISLHATAEAYGNQYDLKLLSDGRFRMEARDRITVFDGEKYWQSYYGMSRELTGEAIEGLREVGFREGFLHGLLDRELKPIPLAHAGREAKRGRSWDLLLSAREDGARRTFYFDGETGLLDRIVEIVPDSTLRERKNLYTFSDYLDVGGLKLPTSMHGTCVTNGNEFQPLTRFTDLALNAEMEESSFSRPETTAPAAVAADGALSGVVLGVSGRGSLITNITNADLEKLQAEDRSTLEVEIRGMRTRHLLLRDPQGLSDVSSGDYVATFNQTPALWLVKAYVGMTSDQPYEVGDALRLSVARTPEKEE
ncbi:MAG: hypothetical protein FJY88_02280 [Candidatus Eisenbacteria bacterium]|nr:hypothetical protein [Candidatus Eisenbacteria bacterium]